MLTSNLSSYLACNDIDTTNLAITNTAENQYQIILSNADEAKVQEIINQVDRDEEHPVTMNGVEVLSQVIKQEPTENPNEYSITVSIVPVTK